MHMQVKVLGPLEVTRYGRDVVPTAAKPRKLLGLLSLYAGRVVPIPSLMEELWEGEPPRSALSTLQTYVLRLRTLIAAAVPPDTPAAPAKDVLALRYAGYCLDTGGAGNDVLEYERLAAAGHRAMTRRDHATASERYHEALRLWRGSVLADLEAGPLLDVEIARLEESRLGVLARAAEADLWLGRHQRLLGDLTALAAMHPMHERIHSLYMLALYRSGRRDRALHVYGSLRSTLNRELGMEPSLALRRMQHAILSANPVLDHHGADTDPRAARGGADGADLLEQLVG
ncbi:AfsR/SARP family transcriptional regulator [Allostreptomyces psammosilenae]|nr:AfsR/SARP family transcriptional regulator [Allostreptomyces psammosilenae]